MENNFQEYLEKIGACSDALMFFDDKEPGNVKIEELPPDWILWILFHRNKILFFEIATKFMCRVWTWFIGTPTFPNLITGKLERKQLGKTNLENTCYNTWTSLNRLYDNPDIRGHLISAIFDLRDLMIGYYLIPEDKTSRLLRLNKILLAHPDVCAEYISLMREFNKKETNNVS